jgi:hypothetical protein
MTDPLDVPCPHDEFDAMVGFARQTDGEGGPLVAVQVEMKVWCKQCNEPWRFRGLEAGMDPRWPMCSPDETELRAPIRPASSDPDYGLGLPGYAVRFRQDPALEFVGWMCPCHRRVVRPDLDGRKPEYHLISKDEGETRCNIDPGLWMETWVRPHEEATDATGTA